MTLSLVFPSQEPCMHTLAQFFLSITLGLFCLNQVPIARGALPGAATAPIAAPAAFHHPGLFNSKDELDFIKARVAAKEEPWFGAFTAMQKSPSGSLIYKPNGGKPFDPPVIHVSFRDKAYNVNT